MLNFYIAIITVPGLYAQLFLVQKLQRFKVETWPGGQSAVLGGGTVQLYSRTVPPYGCKDQDKPDLNLH